MGSGKTTTGRVLARKLGWKFIDLDEEIQSGEGQSIADIFGTQGEDHFRKLEQLYLQAVSLSDRRVIALGGGTFINPDNRAIIEDKGVAVWLKVSFDKVVDRVKMDGTRPMFSTTDQAEQLYRSREPIYAHARFQVSTDEKNPEEVADEIVGAIKRS
jgi:shikimate kinase